MPAQGAAALALAAIAVINGRVWTGNPQQPWAEAVASSAEGVIVAVGSTAEVRKAAPREARVIDARGRLVVPGFIDSHVHFITGGHRLASVQLRDVKSRAQFVERIRAFAATVPKGTWITGGDWDHESWGGEYPRREWIDAVTPDHPVWVNRLDGHCALANSAALKLAGALPKEVAGGAIDRDAASGEPTGLFRDNAMSLIGRVVPNPPAELDDRALDAAVRYVAERGVTSVHNMGSWADLATFERARAAGRLKIRVYAAVPLSTWERLRDRVAKSGRGDDRLRIGMLKGFVDGSLGSHTAAFLEPFTDAPNDRGFFVTTPEKLYEYTSGATKAGLHVAVHAIGDRAIRTQLDVFERVLREQKPSASPRFRIEHAQHIAPADVPRFAALGVIASMQPYHAIDDGRWADKVIGPERSRGTYAFRSLLNAKATVAFGSDWFVAPPTPLEGIYAAVTRATLDDKRPGGWVPEQKISVEEALRAYTSTPAFASFEESRKGVLKVGMLADLVVLDRDITRIPAASIRETRVDMTVVGGEVVYSRGQ